MKNMITICLLVIAGAFYAYSESVPEQAPQNAESLSELMVITEKENCPSALTRSEEISAQALAAAPFLFTKRNSKGHLIPGNGVIEKPKNRAAFQIYDKVNVRPDSKVSYKLGDTVDVLKPIRLVPFKGKSAQIVSRNGRGVVVGHTGKKIVVQITNMWGIIAGGERIAPAANFKAVECYITPQTDSKIQASVIARVQEGASTYLSQYFIIDKGADAGITIGDFFKVFEKPSADKLSDELLEAQVVYAGENSSTLIIRKIFKKDLKPGDQAFLSHKSVIPSEAAAHLVSAADDNDDNDIDFSDDGGQETE
ncbi:MAG: hypothetical protein FWE57_08165 [Chitinispirillia bacterium]|nr:hypothetical protein [Chitinispirillia bacterium]